jgi:hypothetical protein
MNNLCHQITEKTPASLNQKISQLDPWQFLLATSEKIADPPDQQSSMDAQHISKKNKNQRERQNLIYEWAANYV